MIKLPPLPEQDGWIGASDLDPDAGQEGLTFASVRALQIATWNAALEAAAKRAQRLKRPSGTDYAEGRNDACDDLVTALRSMKEPQ